MTSSLSTWSRRLWGWRSSGQTRENFPPSRSLQGGSSSPFPRVSKLLRPPVHAPSKRPLLRRRNPPGPSRSPLPVRAPARGKSPALPSTALCALPCASCEDFSSLCAEVLAPRGQGVTIPVSLGCVDHRTAGLTDSDEDVNCSGIFQAQQLVWPPGPQPAPAFPGATQA